VDQLLELLGERLTLRPPRCRSGTKQVVLVIFPTLSSRPGRGITKIFRRVATTEKSGFVRFIASLRDARTFWATWSRLKRPG